MNTAPFILSLLIIVLITGLGPYTFWLRVRNVRLLSELGRVTTEANLAMKAADEAVVAANKLGAEATLQKRRADEFFGIIEGVERERDQWQQLWRQSSQGAGVAQAMLFRHLSMAIQVANSYVERLRKLGEQAPPVVVDRGLQRILGEYAEAHGDPRPEVAGTPAMELADKVNRALLEESVAKG